MEVYVVIEEFFSIDNENNYTSINKVFYNKENAKKYVLNRIKEEKEFDYYVSNKEDIKAFTSCFGITNSLNIFYNGVEDYDNYINIKIEKANIEI